MSSYLNFYVVPVKFKKKYARGEEEAIEVTVELPTEPLLLMAYSRNTDVYKAYYETLHPAYAGNEDAYTELTVDEANLIVKEYEEDINKTEERLKIDYKMLKEGGYSDNLWDDIHSMESLLAEEKNTLSDLKFIASLVEDCYNDWTDFEKVLININ